MDFRVQTRPANITMPITWCFGAPAYTRKPTAGSKSTMTFLQTDCTSQAYIPDADSAAFPRYPSPILDSRSLEAVQAVLCELLRSVHSPNRHNFPASPCGRDYHRSDRRGCGVGHAMHRARDADADAAAQLAKTAPAAYKHSPAYVFQFHHADMTVPALNIVTGVWLPLLASRHRQA